MTGFSQGRAHQYLASELRNAPTSLMILNDYKSSIQIITVDCASWRTRHLRIRAAGLKEQYLLGQVLVGFVSGSRNGADVGTKSVPFCRLRELLGILGLAVFQEDTPASGPPG